MDKLLQNILLIDIETVPQAANWETLNDTWQALWTEKMSKIATAGVPPEESYEQRAGILAEFSKIICISIGYFHTTQEGQLTCRIKSFFGEEEAILLQQFIADIDCFYNNHKQIVWAGHNIREFDLPFICRRLLTNHLKLSTYFPLPGSKPWENQMIDTLQWWKFGDYKHYTSLNLLAHVLQIPTSKTDMDGSMVKQVYYEEKNLPRIVEYCERDIIVVANILMRFYNRPLLTEENICITSKSKVKIQK